MKKKNGLLMALSVLMFIGTLSDPAGAANPPAIPPRPAKIPLPSQGSAPSNRLTTTNIKPSGPDSLVLQQRIKIQWSYSYSGGPPISVSGRKVKIELLRNGTLAGTIADNVPMKDKQRSWYAGQLSNQSYVQPGSGFAIRVSVAGGQSAGVSAAPFAINPLPPFSVESPSGNLMQGQEVRVAWRYEKEKFTSGTQVKFELLRGSQVIGTIVSREALEAALGFAWKAGTFAGGEAPVADGYCIRMSTLDGVHKAEGPAINLKAYAASVPITFKDIKPCGPQEIKDRQSLNITWDYTGNQVPPNMPVRIELMQDDHGIGTIADGIPVSHKWITWIAGSYRGGNVPAGHYYAIRLSTMDGKYNAAGSPSFYLALKKPLEIQFPTGDLTIGKEVIILWKFDSSLFSDFLNTKINLELLKNDAVVGTIAHRVSLSPAQYKWKAGLLRGETVGGITTANTAAAGDGYGIRIITPDRTKSGTGPVFRLNKPIRFTAQAKAASTAVQQINKIRVRLPKEGGVCRLNESCTVVWNRKDVKIDAVLVMLMRGNKNILFMPSENTGKYRWPFEKSDTRLVGDGYYFKVRSADNKQEGDSGKFRIDHYSQMLSWTFEPKSKATFATDVQYSRLSNDAPGSGPCGAWRGQDIYVSILFWNNNPEEYDDFGQCYNHAFVLFDVKPNFVPAERIRKATLTFSRHFMSSQFSTGTGGTCDEAAATGWQVLALSSGYPSLYAPGQVLAATPPSDNVVIDATQLVKDWASGARSNYGLLFRPTDEPRHNFGGSGCYNHHNDHFRIKLDKFKLVVDYEEYY